MPEYEALKQIQTLKYPLKPKHNTISLFVLIIKKYGWEI